MDDVEGNRPSGGCAREMEGRCCKNRGIAIAYAHSIRFALSSQQCFSLTPNQHQSSATNQPAVLFSHNKSVPTAEQIGHRGFSLRNGDDRGTTEEDEQNRQERRLKLYEKRWLHLRGFTKKVRSRLIMAIQDHD